MSPIEKNARRLVGVLVQHFPAGATCEDLRRQFEKDTSLARQSFYNALNYVKGQGWFVGGGKDRWERRDQLYTLNPDGSWKEPPVSIGEQLEKARLDNDRLEYLANSKLRPDWRTAGRGRAVTRLEFRWRCQWRGERSSLQLSPDCGR